MFEVGDTVGSYTILAHLRSGGMADLFLARRDGAAGFRRHVAIKVIHPRHAQDEQLVRMFLDEALISARIDHPNVVHVEDLGELRGTYFLVMEYVHGSSVAQLLKMLSRLHRRLSPQVAVAIAARVAEGLHAAHETTDDDGALVNLVHRDVSPQNILVSHKGHVKLIDFGVAKAKLRSEETNVAMLKGKVRYMPPEQATTGIVDRRSDIYSLGIVLWEMLTMRRLFTGKTEFEVLLKVRDPKIVPPSRFARDVPPELDEVVLSALSPYPDERPKTAKAFRRALARALPKSMTLDSAHLADLVLSVVGDELENIRHELPQEVSKLLEAEQLRVALAEREDRTTEGDDDTTESIVDVMTLHSDIVAFEEDELDARPEPSSAIPFQVVDAATKPGSPIAQQRRSTSVLRSDETDALRLPTVEEAEPTMVGDAPPGVQARVAQPVPDSYAIEQEESEDVPTLPRPQEQPLPVMAPPGLQGALGPPALEGAVYAPRPQGLPIRGSTLQMRPQRRGLAIAAAVLGAGVLFGVVLAIVLALRRNYASPEAPPVGLAPDEAPAIVAGPAVEPSSGANGAPAPDDRAGEDAPPSGDDPSAPTVEPDRTPTRRGRRSGIRRRR